MIGSSLAGLTVLVTRPAGQAADLCRLIESSGGRALLLPLLEIAPVEDRRAAVELLCRHDYWDWMIFVSANAVRFARDLDFVSTLRQARPRIAAVGAATARELAGAGIRVDLIPKPQFNSESLLAAPELADVAGKRILIVRGIGGRELLGEVLRGRGAETAYAELYQRIPGTGDFKPCLEAWRRGEIAVVAVTSGEALCELNRLLGETESELRARTPLVVIGTRLAGLAREQGWLRVTVAAEASDPGIADTIIRLHNDGGLLPHSEPDLKNTH